MYALNPSIFIVRIDIFMSWANYIFDWNCLVNSHFQDEKKSTKTKLKKIIYSKDIHKILENGLKIYWPIPFYTHGAVAFSWKSDLLTGEENNIFNKYVTNTLDNIFTNLQYYSNTMTFLYKLKSLFKP